MRSAVRSQATRQKNGPTNHIPGRQHAAVSVPTNGTTSQIEESNAHDPSDDEKEEEEAALGSENRNNGDKSTKRELEDLADI